jgi:hypothetical protein
MVFPSTRDREGAFKLSMSLRTFYCLRCYPAPVMRACGWLFYEPRELDECQLAHEYIIAQRNIHFWMAIKPAAGLVCGGRPDKVSLTSLEVVRFRSDSLRLEWS